MKGLGCQRCVSKDVVYDGGYYRKQAGVYIRRIKCKDCGVSIGWLPPFLLKNKRYTVHELQRGIEIYISNSSGYASIRLPLPEDSTFSSETLRNWVDYFSKQSKKFYQAARSILAELRPKSRFYKDKRLQAYSFPPAGSRAKTNGLVHLYQLFILREYFAFLVEPEDFLVWLIFVSRLGRNKKFKTTRLGLGNNKQIGNNSS